MANLKKYFDYLEIIEKGNRQLNLNHTDAMLLNTIAKSSLDNKTLNVKDLLVLSEIASQATIHASLKKLARANLAMLKENQNDGRFKEVTLSKLALRHYETLSEAIASV